MVFPDIPGVAAMGHAAGEALLNAEDALRDYAVETERDGDEIAHPSTFQLIETPSGNQHVSKTLIRSSVTNVGADYTS